MTMDGFTFINDGGDEGAEGARPSAHGREVKGGARRPPGFPPSRGRHRPPRRNLAVVASRQVEAEYGTAAVSESLGVNEQAAGQNQRPVHDGRSTQ